MANVSGASLGGIYDRLHDASEYPPLTAKTFADWSMEAGDIVTIQRDGKSYTSPAMNNTTVWRKKQQVSVNSTGKEKHDTVAKMSQRKFRGGSASLRATQKAFEQIITSYNEMTAGLILASSTAHLYVDNKYTQMTSGLFLTASTAKLYTDDRYRQMSSGLELSTSTAKLYVDNRYAQMQAGLMLTSSTAHLYVDNKYAQMTAGLNLTSSTAKLYVDNKYAQMTAGLDLTSSTAKLYTDNKYTQMSSGLALSTSSAKLYVDNKYAQMTAGLNLTSSTAKLYVDNKYAQMTAGLNLTSSTAKLYVDNKYTQMSSGLALSTSTAKLYVDNRYSQMSSGLELSTSTAKLYTENKYTQMSAGLALSTSSALLAVSNAYTQMSSGLALSTSTAKLYVDDKYSQMSSGLELSTSTAKLYVDNKYSEMSSGLELSTSTAKLYVDNKYSQMTAGLELSTSAAILYAGSATNAASIAAKINESTGQSQIILDADHIDLNGYVKATDITADLIKTKISLIDTMSVGYVSVAAGKSITINGSSSGTSTELSYASVIGIIKDLKVTDNGNNTYTLYKKNYNGGDSDWISVATFNRGGSVTPVLSSNWSAGKLTVSSTPAAQANYEVTLVQKAVTWDGTTATVPISVQWGSSGQYEESTGWNVTISCTGDYERGWKDGWNAYYNDGPDWDEDWPSGNDREVYIPRKQGTGSGEFDYYNSAYGRGKGNGSNDTCVKWFTYTPSSGTYYSKNMDCTDKEQTYPGSTTYYYYFRLEGNYSFTVGTRYTFYRTSWPT